MKISFTLFAVLLTATTAVGQTSGSTPAAGQPSPPNNARIAPTSPGRPNTGPGAPNTGMATPSTDVGSSAPAVTRSSILTNQFTGPDPGLLQAGALTSFNGPGSEREITPEAATMAIANLRAQIEQLLPVLAALSVANGTVFDPLTVGNPLAANTSAAGTNRVSSGGLSSGQSGIGIGEPNAAPGQPALAPGQPQRALSSTLATDGSSSPDVTAEPVGAGSTQLNAQLLTALQNDLHRILPLLRMLDSGGLRDAGLIAPTNSTADVNTPVFYTNEFGITVDNSRMPVLDNRNLTPTGR